MPLTDPWFWAFLAAVGWGLGFGTVGTHVLGRSLPFGIIMFTLAEVPRIVLPLSVVVQPRIAANPILLVAVGALILAASLVFASPVFRIVPLTAPSRQELLRTDGLYAVVRHPLMLCDVFWPLGWSLICASAIGVALTPVWLLIIWVLTEVEEHSLVREYGDTYREFQSRVPRLFPRFPRPRGRRAA